MISLLRLAYTSAVTAGMFLVRMLMLGIMALLQITLGGADIRHSDGESDRA